MTPRGNLAIEHESCSRAMSRRRVFPNQHACAEIELNCRLRPPPYPDLRVLCGAANRLHQNQSPSGRTGTWENAQHKVQIAVIMLRGVSCSAATVRFNAVSGSRVRRATKFARKILRSRHRSCLRCNHKSFGASMQHRQRLHQPIDANLQA